MGPAYSTPDTTAPQVKLAAAAFVKKGAAIGTDANRSLPANITWKTSDPSGICEQSMELIKYYTDGSDDGDDPGIVERPPLTAAARQATVRFGLEYYQYLVRLRVSDCAGNVTSANWAYYPYEWSPEWGPNRPYRDFTTTGSWTSARCACWTDGAVMTSSQPGARARFTSTVNSGVAIVGNTAANRGKVRIWVDGRAVTTLDLKGPTVNRTVIFAQRWPDYGTHTIELEVVSGRVDLDAIVSID